MFRLFVSHNLEARHKTHNWKTLFSFVFTSASTDDELDDAFDTVLDAIQDSTAPRNIGLLAVSWDETAGVICESVMPEPDF